MPVLGVAGNIVTLKRVNPQKWSRKKRKKRLKRPAKVAPVVQKLVVPAKGGEKNPIRRYTAYALELEDGYYYVGITARHDVNVRYIEHSNGKGSKWTRLHKPRSVIETRLLGVMALSEACKLEDEMTLEYMFRHGMYPVRGGGYCQVKDAQMARRFEGRVRITML